MTNPVEPTSLFWNGPMKVRFDMRSPCPSAVRQGRPWSSRSTTRVTGRRTTGRECSRASSSPRFAVSTPSSSRPTAPRRPGPRQKAKTRSWRFSRSWRQRTKPTPSASLSRATAWAEWERGTCLAIPGSVLRGGPDGRSPRDSAPQKRPPAHLSLVIHSRTDEVVPLAPTSEAVARLRNAGARVELVVVDVPHYESARFEPHLKKAVEWLRENWAQTNR